MADRPDAYVRKEPGDPIRSGDWNELQIRAREELLNHRHTGKNQGVPIARAGIEPNAIDGSRIDPTAEVTVNTLTTGGDATACLQESLAEHVGTRAPERAGQVRLEVRQAVFREGHARLLKLSQVLSSLLHVLGQVGTCQA